MISRLSAAAAAAVAALAASWPLAVQACSTAGTSAACVTAPARPSAGASGLTSGSVASPAVAIGQVLDRGAYSILLNAEYFEQLRDQIIQGQPAAKQASMANWFKNLMEGIERNLLTKNRDR